MDLITAISHPNFILNNISFDTRYQYVLLTHEYIDQVVEVFTQAFCDFEPMTAHLALDKDLYRVFARSVTEKAVADRLSVIALDRGKVIACALTEDIADPGAIPDFDPKFKYILALLESLGEKFFSHKQFAKKQIAHLFITAVHKEYRHQGISTQVNFHAMDLANAHGFKSIYCEFTHHFNENGVIHHLRNQKRLIGQSIYADFSIAGKKPFAGLAGGAHSFLWDISGKNIIVYRKENASEIYVESIDNKSAAAKKIKA